MNNISLPFLITISNFLKIMKIWIKNILIINKYDTYSSFIWNEFSIKEISCLGFGLWNRITSTIIIYKSTIPVTKKQQTSIKENLL